MPLSAKQLAAELGTIIDPALATAAVESYIEMMQRFMVGDWQPTELDGGRLCEAIARCCYQLDSGLVVHTQMPGEICDKLEDVKGPHHHLLTDKDRQHVCRVIRLVYKFRSDRGSVHISLVYKADYMDSMLMVHAAKWIFAEFLRLAWKKDKAVIAETIASIVQLEYTLIHELDGKPLVLDQNVSGPEELLLLLNHADNHRLPKDVLLAQAKNNTPSSLTTALSRLLAVNEVRAGDGGDLILTPKGQKRVVEKIIPKLSK